MARQPNGPTWRQVANGKGIVSKPYRAHSHRAGNDRPRHDIDCPFCDTTVTAYDWSIAGGGKRCDCGAMFASRHGRAPTAYHFAAKAEAVQP